jgi:hypothetical protein
MNTDVYTFVNAKMMLLKLFQELGKGRDEGKPWRG